MPLSRGASEQLELAEAQDDPRALTASYGMTFLHLAAALGNTDLVQHVVEQGYQTGLNVADRGERSPLVMQSILQLCCGDGLGKPVSWSIST
ncbi:hypothetical protein B0T25DRAFT_570275 [Lasiosphaeria hispida]|uniref:Ankyrin n=1 Tax=Lasiosphaeria hispida TaxID=260671 RepID=A0AAJ0HFE0_9PEZI|nr:hypothetical protein B0T25DRAFT_570275 [Lasiosphaeria hispida]